MLQQDGLFTPHHPALRGPADEAVKLFKVKVGAEPQALWAGVGTLAYISALAKAVLPTVVMET